MLTPIYFSLTVPVWSETPQNRTPKFTITTNGTTSEEVEGTIALVESGLITYLLCFLINFYFITAEYVFRHQIVTLTVIESTGEDFQSLKKSDEREDKAFAKEAEAQRAYELAMDEAKEDKTKPKPITSGVRRTVRYLYAIDGLRGIFRGAQIMLIWSFGHRMIGLLVSYAFVAVGLQPQTNLDAAVTDFLSSIILSPLSLAWNHRAISQDFYLDQARFWRRPATFSRLFHPSTIYFYIRRMGLPQMPSKSALKAQLLPCAMAGAVQIVYHLMPKSFLGPLTHRLFESGSRDPGTSRQRTSLAVFTLLFYVEHGILRLFAWAMHEAAAISLTRVQTSLLPEGLQPIIPTDRALNVGLAASNQIAREDKWRMLFDAWRSTKWGTIRRYLKNCIKHIVLTWVITLPLVSISLFFGDFVTGYTVEYGPWPFPGPQPKPTSTAVQIT